MGQRRERRQSQSVIVNIADDRQHRAYVLRLAKLANDREQFFPRG